MKITKQQHDNLIYARDWWKTVPPETVAEDLSTWNCGTHACFGGHVAMNDHFKAQGVTPSNVYGCPMMEGENFVEDGDDVAKILFGSRMLFAYRNGNSLRWIEHGRTLLEFEKDKTHTDHEVVANRIQWMLDHCEVQA
jgi:hypothetical protein